MLSKRIVMSVLVVGVLGGAASIATAFSFVPAGNTTEAQPAVVESLAGRGCPDGFVGVSFVRAPEVDRNRDGIICEKVTEGATVRIDNAAEGLK